jgi:hypothetical protein
MSVSHGWQVGWRKKISRGRRRWRETDQWVSLLFIFKCFFMLRPHQHNHVLLVKGVRIPGFAVHGGMSDSDDSWRRQKGCFFYPNRFMYTLCYGWFQNQWHKLSSTNSIVELTPFHTMNHFSFRLPTQNPDEKLLFYIWIFNFVSLT